MPMTDTILTTFEQLRGLPCWGLRFGMHTNLSMNFGSPSLRIREPLAPISKQQYKRRFPNNTHSQYEVIRRLRARRKVTIRGQWRLGVWCCYWRGGANAREG